MSTTVTMTFEEVLAWATSEFPYAFNALQHLVDKIMIPSKLETGYNPNGYGKVSGPMPHFKDWIKPHVFDRNHLGMDLHSLLSIGYYEPDQHQMDPRRKTKFDLLVVYSVPASHRMRLARKPGNGDTYQPLFGNDILDHPRLTLYPLWRAIKEHTPAGRSVLSLINIVALWLHVQRMMIPKFTGACASKENFRAACEAVAASTHPLKQPFRPFPGRAFEPVPFLSAPEHPPVSLGESVQPSFGKRKAIEDAEERPAQRVKGEDWEARVKELEGKMKALEMMAKRGKEEKEEMVKENEVMMKEKEALKKENEVLKGEKEAMKEKKKSLKQLLMTMKQLANAVSIQLELE